jgi:hypothetical protein
VIEETTTLIIPKFQMSSGHISKTTVLDLTRVIECASEQFRAWLSSLERPLSEHEKVSLTKFVDSANELFLTYTVLRK